MPVLYTPGYNITAVSVNSNLLKGCHKGQKYAHLYLPNINALYKAFPVLRILQNKSGFLSGVFHISGSIKSVGG